VERQGYALSLRKIHDDDWAVGFHQHALRAPEGFSTAATPFVACPPGRLENSQSHPDAEARWYGSGVGRD